jgi:tetrapyrrole methylase family protein/MazG family protein
MQAFTELLKIAKKLRSPTGCPWDRKQTIATMSKYVEEEADEILQAIQKKDYKNLEEEIGDVIFNLVMLTQIASEEKRFTMESVLKPNAKKIKARHTWVFGRDAAKVKTAEDALALWKENKKKIKS